ncbi:putative histidine kinase sensor of two-component system [Longispora fulva]|uniref:Signal transduction histidine-protein kinase/phosphatase MprB n=2 Tax=Longispora fulva TaxID=619741 RepID=A0A8J7KS60_9ACTN|nr:signal transduction histidine kinase [Longispora fulva]GIG58751.1 putative histidine kinase sensor of two-component system [Longispora fulva]
MTGRQRPDTGYTTGGFPVVRGSRVGEWAAEWLRRVVPRPLDPVHSIKMKIGILVAASIWAAAMVFYFGVRWPMRYTLFSALVVALGVTQVIAHGMTSPLRQMTAAARAMARGDYGQRVRATSRDEVGELARAFNQMATDLAAADRQRREFIANVSHELRTPITALQGVLENVVDGVSDPSTLQAALAQTERLGRLVTELLDLSRLEAGAAPLNRVSFPAKPFLVEATALSAAVVDAPDDLMVTADRERLHQVVANLLANAYQHGPADGRVTVAARRAGGTVLFEVTDEGPGIPVDQRERVFERFIRGDRAIGAVADGGTGLGLAIARWVVQLHGGTIAVVGSDPGCRIQFTLPA